MTVMPQVICFFVILQDMQVFRLLLHLLKVISLQLSISVVMVITKLAVIAKKKLLKSTKALLLLEMQLVKYILSMIMLKQSKLSILPTMLGLLIMSRPMLQLKLATATMSSMERAVPIILMVVAAMIRLLLSPVLT